MKKITTLTALALLTFLFGAGLVLASIDPPIKLDNPLKGTDTIGDLLHKIVDFLMRDIGPIIAVGAIIYGAFLMLTAGGDPEKFSLGKKAILYAVIGYAIILVGWGVTTLIQNVLS
jgi:hypothetical protein